MVPEIWCMTDGWMTDKKCDIQRWVPHLKKYKNIKSQSKPVQKESTDKSGNFTLKAIQIRGQRKAFYGQRIPESSYGRQETLGIDILTISRDDDRKIMHSIRISIQTSLRIRNWDQLSQFR